MNTKLEIITYMIREPNNIFQIWVGFYDSVGKLGRKFHAYKSKTEKQAAYLSQFAEKKALAYYKKKGIVI